MLEIFILSTITIIGRLRNVLEIFNYHKCLFIIVKFFKNYLVTNSIALFQLNSISLLHLICCLQFRILLTDSPHYLNLLFQINFHL